MRKDFRHDHSRSSQTGAIPAGVTKATRAYKDLNWLSMRLLRPNGTLVSFSCSGLVDEELFQKILFSASLDAGRDAQIIAAAGSTRGSSRSVVVSRGKIFKGISLQSCLTDHQWKAGYRERAARITTGGSFSITWHGNLWRWRESNPRPRRFAFRYLRV